MGLSSLCKGPKETGKAGAGTLRAMSVPGAPSLALGWQRLWRALNMKQPVSSLNPS